MGPSCRNGNDITPTADIAPTGSVITRSYNGAAFLYAYSKSHWRGGWRSNYGSLVWADAREWMQDKEKAYGFSVVGHTQLKNHVIEDNFAFLDSRNCFYLNENGKFIKFKKES